MVNVCHVITIAQLRQSTYGTESSKQLVFLPWWYYLFKFCWTVRYSGKLHNSRTRGLLFISFLRWDKVISKFPYDNLAIQFNVTLKSRLGTIQWAQILILGTCLEYFFETLVFSSNSVQPFLFAIVLTSTLAKIIHP